MYDGGHFTRWAVVFLIIFVLFILLIPHHDGYAGGGYAGGGYAGGAGAGVGAY
ncbi:hypothetical protein SAMN05421543_1501 [Alicyclobacillus macrosporangiidus]|uniref:Uncharacterized protein n=1 Tax=Alicyclobacillus macrosporangiidus TaxID=392015 RepID=A0A1I7LH26_9BACL|nr:hypothetical protein SAMN05421543_1501 [Alicyclobacillus macrosporangiidus]